MKDYYVYILTNSRHTVLYIGITNNLVSRLYQHKEKQTKGFTSKYNVNKLVYFEQTTDPIAAISREKQIKKWSRIKKENLINTLNAEWRDLSVEMQLF